MGRVSRRWSAGDGVLGSPGRGSDYSQGQRQILSRDEDQSVRRQAGRQIVQRLLLPDSVRPPPAIAQPQHWSLFTRHNGPLFRRHRHTGERRPGAWPFRVAGFHGLDILRGWKWRFKRRLPTMNSRLVAAPAVAISTLAVIALLGMMLVSSSPVRAQNDNNQGDEDESKKIQQGFAIAPVPLNLVGKDRALVG